MKVIRKRIITDLESPSRKPTQEIKSLAIQRTKGTETENKEE